ncbi:uncharacterized protein LTHEOB_132 [Lasiodiplodia theobromae]|uniref:uncharacterized protein n=1 Tax=Lasiodiplodia theobromae TaxID=45133 RepID=UPI0015C3DDCD|nr:uncharacterized protein LTHEOB_132 [Lasiodiplodia theobromae]KAF4543433.1 hypothetical protein LTHEOB_132 [Lasiodiplodia theobromae]
MVTVSSSFQAAVERHVFDRISLKSKDLKRFQALYHGHRTRFLHSIVFTIKFPKLENTDDEDEPLPCRESLEDIQSIDQFFTRHIKQLFNAIKALEEQNPSTMDGISLTIRVTRPSDYNKEADYCDHRRWPCWRLHLLSPTSLPPLSSIRSLSFQDAFPSYYDDWGGERSRHLDMRALLDLAAKLPNLQHLRTRGPLERFPVSYLRDEATQCRRVWEGPWCDTRLAFAAAAAALNHVLPLGTLTTLKLHFFAADQASMCDQTRPLPDLTDGRPRGHDPLSAALHALSLNLVELDLRAVVDPSLFWPSSSSSPSSSPPPSPPHWPRLRRLRVEFHNCTPDGSWYFDAPHGHPDDNDRRGFPVTETHYPPLGPDPHPADAAWDEYWSYVVDDLEPDVFRVRPRETRIEPLLVAFGRALGCMPRLQAAEVFTWVGWAPRGEEEREGEAGEVYGVEEVGRWRNGFVHRWGVGVEVGREGRRARVRWEVGGWRAGEEVGRVLRGGLGEEGVEVEEVWVPFALMDRRREKEEGSGWDSLL